MLVMMTCGLSGTIEELMRLEGERGLQVVPVMAKMYVKQGAVRVMMPLPR
jgi:hypothetical protein